MKKSKIVILIFFLIVSIVCGVTSISLALQDPVNDKAEDVEESGEETLPEEGDPEGTEDPEEPDETEEPDDEENPDEKEGPDETEGPNGENEEEGPEEELEYICLDGVDGDDELADGSLEAPYYSFGAAYEAANGRALIVLNTVTVLPGEEQRWSEVQILRGGSGVLIDVRGALTLEHVTLDGAFEEEVLDAMIVVSGSEAELYIAADTILRNNRNQAAGGSGSEDGGAVRCEAGMLKIDNSSVSDNQSVNGKGGAVYSAPGSSLIVSGSEFFNNGAEKAGGGIYIQQPEIPVEWSRNVVRGNRTAGNGGGICLEEAVLSSSTGIIEGNESVRNGGGIYADAYSRIELEYDKIKDNTAGVDEAEGAGGGIYIEEQQYQYITAEQTEFRGNLASWEREFLLSEEADSGYSYYYRENMDIIAVSEGDESHSTAYNNLDINYEPALRIRKVDASSMRLLEHVQGESGNVWQEARVLEGVEYQVYYCVCEELLHHESDVLDESWLEWDGPVVSDAQGVLTVQNLNNAYAYRMAEIKPADTYKYSEIVWRIVPGIDGGAEITVTGAAGANIVKVDREADGVAEYWSYAAESFTLPYAGGDGDSLFFITGLVLILIAFILLRLLITCIRLQT